MSTQSYLDDVKKSLRELLSGPPSEAVFDGLEESARELQMLSKDKPIGAVEVIDVTDFKNED